jgi:hypothetical protein
MRFSLFLFIPFLAIMSTGHLHSQPPPVSPRDSAKTSFDGKKIAVYYGKPSVRGRNIFGNVVKYYRVWRTGDGAATTLVTDVDIELDGAIIPKGTYTLYTLPSDKIWKLIINKQTGQWGTVYNDYLDLARVDMKVANLKTSAEDLAFKIEKSGNNSGLLKIEWDKTSLSIPFHVGTEGLKASPRDSTLLFLSDKRFVIEYGSPSVRGRKIMGGVVPYNVVWRTGANEATKFIVGSDILLGGMTIPSGTYSLFTIPSEKQWKLILNKQSGQWGTVYDRKLDLARVSMKKRTLKEPVERFTIKLEKKSETSGVVMMAWEKTELSIVFKLK